MLFIVTIIAQILGIFLIEEKDMINYIERLEKFQALVEASAHVAFLPISADLHYLMGIPRDIPNYGRVMHPAAWIEGAWIIPQGEPILLLSRMTAEFGGLNNLGDVQVKVLGDWDDPTLLIQEIFKPLGDVVPKVAISDEARGETITALHKLYPQITFVSATKLLHQLRVVKSLEEIALMRRAGEITEAAFRDVVRQLKIGMTELDIISEVDYQLRRHGSLGPSFTTTLYCSGPNHPLLFGERLKTWPRKLNPPVSVLFDFGAVYEGFCYDFGRTVSFGEPSAEQIQIHKLVMAAQSAGITAMKAGQATAEAVDAAARQVIEAGGYGSAFRHRLGHGIGMDVHEPPFLTRSDQTILQEGMLFTVEPSITQFNGFSARVEDVVLTTFAGGKPLTSGFQELVVVE